MTERVIRFSDYKRKSREPDGAQPRNPVDADVIVFPTVRRLNSEPIVDHREIYR